MKRRLRKAYKDARQSEREREGELVFLWGWQMYLTDTAAIKSWIMTSTQKQSEPWLLHEFGTTSSASASVSAHTVFPPLPLPFAFSNLANEFPAKLCCSSPPASPNLSLCPPFVCLWVSQGVQTRFLQLRFGRQQRRPTQRFFPIELVSKFPTHTHTEKKLCMLIYAALIRLETVTLQKVLKSLFQN